MINVYAISIAGPTHLKNNKPCQDAFHFIKSKDGIVVGAVADGVSMDIHSDVASNIAARDSVEYTAANFTENMSDEAIFALMERSFAMARSHILATAAENGDFTANQYGTTLCMCVYNGEKLWFAQSGDSGLVVLLNNGEYRLVTEQQRGLCGGTYTLCKERMFWDFGVINEPIYSVMLMTDGVLEQVAHPLLRDEEYKIVVPLAESLMNLSHIPDNELAAYEAAAFKYIENYPEDHLDDDKTLLVFFNSDITPAKMADDYYLPPNWAEVMEKRKKRFSQKEKEEELNVSKEKFENEVTALSPAHLVPMVDELSLPSKPSVRIMPRLIPIVSILLLCLFSLFCFFNYEHIIEKSGISLFGLFVSNCTAKSCILLPTSTLAIVCKHTAVLNPILVAITAALGATFGDYYAYMLGENMGKLLSFKSLSVLYSLPVKHHYIWTFIFSLLPLPFFDLVAIYAGIASLNDMKFLLATFLGKFFKLFLIASFISTRFFI